MLTALQPYDLKLVKTFLAVADAGGFTAAQVRLGRSLSAISSDIQALELRFGTQLCRRGRSGFALTEYGQKVYVASRDLFEAVDRFQHQIQFSREHLEGSLRISLNEGHLDDASFALANTLARFGGRPKNFVKLSVSIVPFERTLEMIFNDEVDIGFGFFTIDHARVERMPLYRERNQLYCGRTHPLFAIDDAALSLEQVTSYPFVLRTPRIPSHYPAIVAEVEPAAFGLTPESRTYLILSGHYLGYLAEHQAADAVRAGLLRPVLPDAFGFDATMQLAVKQMTKRPAQVDAFLVDYAVESAALGHPLPGVHGRPKAAGKPHRRRGARG